MCRVGKRNAMVLVENEMREIFDTHIVKHRSNVV